MKKTIKKKENDQCLFVFTYLVLGRCANEFWVEIRQKTQHTGNICGMHDGIKKGIGPVQRNYTSLRSCDTHGEKQ